LRSLGEIDRIDVADRGHMTCVPSPPNCKKRPVRSGELCKLNFDIAYRETACSYKTARHLRNGCARLLAGSVRPPENGQLHPGMVGTKSPLCAAACDRGRFDDAVTSTGFHLDVHEIDPTNPDDPKLPPLPEGMTRHTILR
jgi:hypothetical protein